MKKVLLSAALVCAGLLANAQLVEVASVQQVRLPEGVLVNQATMAPDGSFVVVSDLASTALSKVDLASGDCKKIVDNGSALDLKISADGSRMVYRNTVTNGRLRYTGLKALDLRTGSSVEVVKPSRHLGGFELSKAGVVSAVNAGKMSTKSLAGAKTAEQPVVSINRGHLELTAGGKTVTLDPQGRGSYLWPSISPDGTKIAYYKAQAGCFVCDLDGSNVRKIGFMHAPKWLDNSTLVGCRALDDGKFITESKILVADLNGTMQAITGPEIVAVGPSPAADGKSIAFSDNFGALYVITLR